MRLKIEYIANYLGLDIKNTFVLADIAEIKDIDGFMVFMKDNIKSTRLDYLNALQKLTELKKMYLAEVNRDRLDSARSESFRLALKFRELKPQLREIDDKVCTRYLSQNIDGEMIRCFTDFENATFEKVGNLKRLIYLDDNFKLEEELDKIFFGIIYNGSKQLLIAQKSTNDSEVVQSITSVVKLALKGKG